MRCEDRLPIALTALPRRFVVDIASELRNNVPKLLEGTRGRRTCCIWQRQMERQANSCFL